MTSTTSDTVRLHLAPDSNDRLVVADPDDDTDYGVNVEVAEQFWLDLQDKRREVDAQVAALAKMESWLQAQFDAAAKAEEEAERQRERDADTAAQQVDDQEHGPRDYWVHGYGWPRRQTERNRVIHLVTCEATPPWVRDDFLHSERMRAQDVPLLGKVCSTCKPRQFLDAASDFSTRAAAADAAAKAAWAQERERKAITRPPATYDRVRRLLARWYLPNGSRHRYAFYYEVDVTPADDGSSETRLRWTGDRHDEPRIRMDALIKGAPEQGWIVERIYESGIYRVSRMSPNEVKAYEQAKGD
jgi:hypothetical protein